MTKKSFFRDLSLLSLPIIIGQVGIMLIGIGDVFIASKHSSLSLASIGIALNIINPVFLFGIGLMMGSSSFLSIRKGRGSDMSDCLKSSLVYCFVISAFLVFISYLLMPVITMLGLIPEMIPYIESYLNIVILSFPFAFLYQILKDYLQAQENVAFANAVAVLSALLNLPLNYVLVFGMPGLAPLGFDGLAYASFIVRVFMAVAMVIYLKKDLLKGYINYNYIKDLFRFSFPIAAMFFLEVSGFCLFGVLAGKFSVLEAATNNLILNIASLTFMVPLSISSAVSVKVGNSYGRKNYSDIYGFSRVSMMMSMSFMGMAALFYLIAPKLIMSLFTSDLAIINLGAQVLFIVAIFQIVDGAQVTLAGILRGIEKTKESFISIFFSFWVMGIPLGIYFGFYLDYRIMGLWSGLALSLTFVSIILFAVTYNEFKKMRRWA